MSLIEPPTHTDQARRNTERHTAKTGENSHPGKRNAERDRLFAQIHENLWELEAIGEQDLRDFKKSAKIQQENRRLERQVRQQQRQIDTLEGKLRDIPTMLESDGIELEQLKQENERLQIAQQRMHNERQHLKAFSKILATDIVTLAARCGLIAPQAAPEEANIAVQALMRWQEELAGQLGLDHEDPNTAALFSARLSGLASCIDKLDSDD